MTSAEKTINALRVALKYSTGADRRAIRAVILGIECGFTKSPAPQRRAHADRSGDVLMPMPVPVADPEPRCTLVLDTRVVIAPDRRSPLRRLVDGAPALFRDDLNAVADHGSPERLGRAEPFGFSVPGSSLG